MNIEYNDTRLKETFVKTFVLFCLGALLISQPGLAQQETVSVYESSSDNQRTIVSVDFVDEPLAEALHELARKVDVGLSYKTKTVPSQLVTYQAKGVSIYDILNRILEGTRLYATLSDNRKVILIKERQFQMATPKQETVTGTVTDAESGETLPGVNILVKGTTTGASTDAEGHFELTVESLQDTLVVSFVGYQTQEMPIGGRTEIDVALQPQAITGEEMVVVGYGTQQKSDIVGSVSSVPLEKLENNSDQNLFQTLQAAAPGLSIQRSSGEPGASGSIQIRGLNSISASNEPLIIYDGIPFAGNIRDINPNNISSVEVLKDASAAAIYGSRASNGVILITSKSGSVNETTIEFNTSWSFQNEAVEYELMDAERFYDVRRAAYQIDGSLEGVAEENIPQIILEQNELISWQNGESINWMNEMLNENAMTQKYQIGVGTGNENIKEYISLSFVDEEGLERSTGFSRITFKNNIELTSLTDWLRIGDNLSYSYNNFERRVGQSIAYYRLSPYARIYNEDGSFTKFPQANDNLHTNPVAENELTTRDNNFNNLFNNFYLEVIPKIIDGFSYRMNFGTSIRKTSSGIYWPSGTLRGDALNGAAGVGDSDMTELTWENILKYKKNIGNHSIDMTGLFSRQSHTFESKGQEASDFVSDDYLWHNMSAAANVNTPETSLNEWDLISYMGRVQYNFDNKYYVTATGRSDGYSGFAEGNKYSFFPSVALAWRISEENFTNEIEWLGDLKLRISYGSVGNQAVGTYGSLATLSNAQPIFGEEITPGLRVSSLANPDLGWETTNTLNFALDFSLWTEKLSGTIEYYNSKTNDILLQRQIPKATGQNSIIFNSGKVQNTGIEIALNSSLVRKEDFSWDINLNFSSNRNKILDLFGNEEDDVANNWFIGKPLGVYYDYEFAGIWQNEQEDEIQNSATPDRSPGDARLIDQNNDGSIDGEDRRIVGYQQPDWIGGLSNAISYKNLSLYIFLQTVQGRDGRLNIQNNDRYGRVNDPPFDFWTPNNPSNSWVRPTIQGGGFSAGSMDIYDASFLRIKDITLSYNLPQSFLRKVGVKRFRVYANLHDYFTFTDYPYMDPESANTYEISIPKYIQFGINLSL